MSTPFSNRTTASQVGSFFLKNYYQLLQTAPQLVHQFYTDISTMMRLDSTTMESSTALGMLQIHDIVTSLRLVDIEIKTANFLESWGAGILVMVTGLVLVKDYNVRRRFVQSFFLAPQVKGYFVLNDIFKFLDYELEHHHPSSTFIQTDYEAKANTTNSVSERAMEEFSAKELVSPVHAEESYSFEDSENLEVQQQVALEPQAITDEAPMEEPDVSFAGSSNPAHDVSTSSEKETLKEVPETYASVLRKKGFPAPRPITNKSNMRGLNSQLSTHPATQPSESQSMSVGVHNKRISETNQDCSILDEGGEYLSVYIGNLSPSTSVFDLEQEFKVFGRIKPDGVAIRSRKEAGVFYGFVEFDDITGVQNALKASPIQLHGRTIHVEERRPNSGLSRGGRRGRGRAGYPVESTMGRSGGKSNGRGSVPDQDTDYYWNHSVGNGYQRRGAQATRDGNNTIDTHA